MLRLAVSVLSFSPDHLRRGITRPVSYYALFKSWLFMQLHILLSTKLKFGTLTGDLGCLPLDYEAYPPQSDSYGTAMWYSEFDNCWYPGKGPRIISALPPHAIA